MRKLILALALVAAVGLGFGWIAEGFCTLGGSYADDPNTPVAIAEFALPAHSQAAPELAMPTIVAGAMFDPALGGGRSGLVSDAHPSLTGSSFQNPRRC